MRSILGTPALFCGFARIALVKRASLLLTLSAIYFHERAKTEKSMPAPGSSPFVLVPKYGELRAVWQ
jgi:hypothetical protein